jgi:hypothetical protein
MIQDKSVYYNSIATIINLPIGLVGWIEAITCDYFFSHIGGHFWYDITIPISLISYFFYIKSWNNVIK